MASLPEPDIRAWLLDALAALTTRHGPALDPPIEPTPEWFPDRWEPTAAGARRVARRLLSYAGLEVGAVVQVRTDRPPTSGALYVSASFEELRRGAAVFAIDPDLLGDPELLAATLAREVARAWRAQRGEEASDADDEEILVDVAAAHLGFAVLGCNAALRVRRAPGLLGARQVSSLGSLTTEQHAFLLAAQAVARGAARAELDRIEAHLPAAGAAAFREALEELGPAPEALRQRLGGPATGRPARTPPEGPEDAPDVDAGAVDGGANEPERPRALHQGWNAGRLVFRVPRRGRRRTVTLIALASTAGMIAGAIALGAPGVWCGLGTGVLAAAWLRWRGPRDLGDVCSDRDCAARIPPDVPTCPRCGGVIGGWIADPSGRLEAEEELVDRLAAAEREEAPAEDPATGGPEAADGADAEGASARIQRR